VLLLEQKFELMEVLCLPFKTIENLCTPPNEGYPLDGWPSLKKQDDGIKIYTIGLNPIKVRKTPRGFTQTVETVDSAESCSLQINESLSS
jgi:hypothetical protein